MFSCDINSSACIATRRTALHNNATGNLEVLRCNLMESIKDRLLHEIDLGTLNMNGTYLGLLLGVISPAYPNNPDIYNML